jgi:hypothetical protein
LTSDLIANETYSVQKQVEIFRLNNGDLYLKLRDGFSIEQYRENPQEVTARQAGNSVFLRFDEYINQPSRDIYNTVLPQTNNEVEQVEEKLNIFDYETYQMYKYYKLSE